MIRTDSFDNLKKDCWTYASKIHKSAENLDGEEFWKSLSLIRKASKPNYEISVEVLNAYFEYLEKSKSRSQAETIIKQLETKYNKIYEKILA